MEEEERDGFEGNVFLVRVYRYRLLEFSWENSSCDVMRAGAAFVLAGA